MNAETGTQLADGSPRGPIDWAKALASHDRWLRTVVAARLGERQAVEEVVQDVSLAAVSARSEVDPARVSGWLYRLAIRHTLLYRRKRGRQRRRDDRYAAVLRESDAPGPDPLAWLIRDERLALVRTALATLPSRDAEILMLKYTEGWSCRALAEHLGQTEAAIESRLHRARAKLRDALGRTNAIEEPR